MSGAERRQPLTARVWGPSYRTWFPPDVPRQRRKAKRRSSRRVRQSIKRRIRDGLWFVSDKLCAWPERGKPNRVSLHIGHWIGELGWLMRRAGG